MVIIRVLSALLLVVLMAGCSEPGFPKDPDGTLLRATGGELRAGLSPNEPHTSAEVAIIEDWAATIESEVVWTEGAESELFELLKLGELDVVVGGLASDSPWSTHGAMTRPYGEVIGPDGKQRKLVLATRLGENALLVSLERFLVEEGLQP